MNIPGLVLSGTALLLSKVMRISRGRWGAVALVLLAACGSSTAAEQTWAPAAGSREWTFPRDHGSHPDFRTEWWYVTGLLRDGEGGEYGYQLTFFRSALRKEAALPGNPWSVRDIYAAHFTVTGLTSKKFAFAERVSREGPGLAGSTGDRLHTWLLDWSMEARGDTLVLEAKEGELELHLTLAAAGRPVLHGTRGLSMKGEAKGQASWYYSMPEMKSRGELRAPWTSRRVRVEGTSWFDHEFGSNQLSPDQEGWDWFGLRLDDGRALMLYSLRRRDGSTEPASSGTLVERDGSPRHLPLDAFSIKVLDRWKSRRSGASYPARWLIEVPRERIRLEVGALVADQELLTAGSTGVTYWEGAVAGEGTSEGKAVRAQGYAELTGYAGALGGLF